MSVDMGMGQAYAGLLRRRLGLIVMIALAIVASFAWDFTTGPAGLAPARLLELLLAPLNDAAHLDADRVIVWDIRLPQALMAVLVGAALGLAGAEMQTVLDNPLASPFTLGLSEAAAFGAALAIVLGAASGWMVAGAAFGFALLAALLLDLVARRLAMNASGVVLFGIALVFSFNALLWLLQYLASPETLQAIVFWIMGSLVRANWPMLGGLAAVLALCLPLALRDAWKLTALRLGEDRAASLGIDVARLRRASLLRVALLAGTAVSCVGTIGFIGLVAPHIARRLCGEDHRFYLPASGLIGALVLSGAAISAKQILPGASLPVGVVTALVGVPFFLAIVLRRGGLS
ncbi:FecCD family ABC transporter permease [Roseateles sp. LKC17W]|uniref:FecCD family ABC transporter permease n=1 Tax=Pelomonas margarita TaxID=3299031 RepID=A0ABW7FIT1_9BURK